MPSQPWTQTIAIHILPNISRSKGNQTKKIDQLIEYNMRNILREKIYAKGVDKFSPDPFLKIQIWAYLWINNLKYYTVCIV